MTDPGKLNNRTNFGKLTPEQVRLWSEDLYWYARHNKKGYFGPIPPPRTRWQGLKHFLHFYEARYRIRHAWSYLRYGYNYDE